LKLLSATCRLAPGKKDTRAAARQWHEHFGVSHADDELKFTNSRLKFVPGIPGQPEGLESITIEITGKERYQKTLDTARKEGLCDNGWIDMLGVKWYLVLKPVSVDSGRTKL
jgi:hypothetical protein